MCLCELSAQQIVALSTTITSLLVDSTSMDEIEVLIVILDQVTNSLRSIVRLDCLQDKICELK